MNTSGRVILLLLLVCACALPHGARAQIAGDVCTDNESWVRMGDGLPGGPYGMANRDGVLHALHSRSWPVTPSDTILGLSNWDGDAWKEITTLTLHTGAPWDTVGIVYAVAAHRGEIFVGGMFQGAEDLPNSKCLVRWDGVRWRSATAGLPDYYYAVMKLKEFAGELYALVVIDGTFLQCFHWTGSAWEAAAPLLRGAAARDLMMWQGRIHVLADINGGTGVIAWDGTAWRQVGALLSNTSNSMVLFHGRLYVVADKLHRLDDTVWTVPDTTTLPSGAAAAGVVDDQLYVWTSGNVWPDPGVVLLRHDGRGGWDSVSNFDVRARGFFEYNGTLIAYGGFTRTCGGAVRHVAMLCTDRTCGTISGNVFDDRDGDCSAGPADRPMPRQIVEITPGPYYAITDTVGRYRKVVPPGAYIVSTTPWPAWRSACPANGVRRVGLKDRGARADAEDFALRPARPGHDLRVQIAEDRIRAGRAHSIAIRYENRGNEPTGGLVRLWLDPGIQLSAAVPEPSCVAADHLDWAFTDLSTAEARTIHVVGMPSRDLVVGTRICAAAAVYAELDSGFDLPEAVDTVCTEVTGSYDPNDMIVQPVDDEKTGTIAPGDSVLAYTVRFQNTGNDTAFHVVLVDTLSPYLDITTLTLGAASHPYDLRIERNSTLVWTFSDIMLPDSAADEQRSHGFVKFSARIRRGVSAFTRIPNRASIYFDFNAPIHTNTVLSTTAGEESEVSVAARRGHLDAGLLRAVPNPARDAVRIDGALAAGAILELRSLLGETIRTIQCRERESPALDVSDVPAGSYLVVARTVHGRAVTRLIVTR